jgi:D-aminoacyl-tRNA deacylase
MEGAGTVLNVTFVTPPPGGREHRRPDDHTQQTVPMRAVVQRVSRAAVRVDGAVVGEIGLGLCVLVGVTNGDTPEEARRLADHVWGVRVMADEAGVMNRSVADVGGSVLVISQFTLYADTAKGRRPSWRAAAPAEVAQPLVDAVADALRQRGLEVATGVFGADMAVELVNDGPVTLVMEVAPAHDTPAHDTPAHDTPAHDTMTPPPTMR